MAIDFSNYINTYKGSPILQQQFPNMNDYLALFGYQPPGTNPVPTLPITKPIQPPGGPVSIIGQDLRSGAPDRDWETVVVKLDYLCRY